MKLVKLLLALSVLSSTGVANAVSLEPQNIEAPSLQKGTVWNVKGVKSASTVYKAVDAVGLSLSSSNYALVNIGGYPYKINAPLSLTQAACATDWGSSGSHLVHLYLGSTVASPTKGPNLGVALCVSDLPNLTTLGAVSVGSTGYVQCSSALGASTRAMRQIGSVTLNCTGPVIGTDYSESDINVGGLKELPIKAKGTASSATASASLVFAVQGLTSSDHCVATPVSLGTGPNYIKTIAVTANTITAVVDTAQSGGSTVIQYVCY